MADSNVGLRRVTKHYRHNRSLENKILNCTHLAIKWLPKQSSVIIIPLPLKRTTPIPILPNHKKSIAIIGNDDGSSF
jgi:hypothetical protein